MTITRIFHPVGQGAFYSEHFKYDDASSFNAVYDCGGLKKRINDSIIGTFDDKDKIDFLFLSHLHDDHISGLTKLLNYEPKHVFLPLIDKVFKIYMCAVAMEHTEDADMQRLSFQLYYEPNVVFGDDTKIIYVKSGDISNNEIRVIESINEIENGSKIIVEKDNSYWMYKVYNNEKLMFDNKDLIESLRQIVNIDNEDEIKKKLSTAMGRKEIVNCYKEKYGDNLNPTSMLVYSGPCYSKQENNEYVRYSFSPTFFRSLAFDLAPVATKLVHKVSCIYTGDYESDKIDKLYDVFKSEWGDVGTVQIPHHGAKDHFDIDRILNCDGGACYICPISFGNENKNHHPSEYVISEITRHQSLPVCINENKESIFIEVIRERGKDV